ncbi:carboxymuconolactone decarboxylase family protein [Undibacterium sp. RTI2.1]|uniref:carboxymuconolactone decarboxylase family protein n=1 Tax=unclassified Undibacterium TaxID=2630295 RepID=UPI002B233406|nr:MULTISPECIES: carboxymuconolactone decarboxylase family protein [unclassified Undibacterium]MEB0031563.1 carboxymuconolactone decarboxylase family protein [Undibacterium sp. RTI2.1]MEB0117867.1 carboxymuconolactone decarboxylase family protein [Undibacterium sp. RTI2.2]
MFSDWKSLVPHIKKSFGTLSKAHPKMVAAYQALDLASADGGALDPKTRELISLAVAVTTRCDGCIGTHAQAAATHGATEAEIAAALATAISLNAGAAYVYSLHALEAFSSFSDAKKLIA